MHALLKDNAAVSALRCFSRVALGGKVRLSHGNNKTISCERVGFRNGRTSVMARAPMADQYADPMRGKAPSQQRAGLAQQKAGLPIERAEPGLGKGHGAINGCSAVLVESAVHNEPVDHVVREILFHYIVLERNSAERRHFPSINKFESVSRATPGCNTPQEQSLAPRIPVPRAGREVPVEFIGFGARKAGTNGELDFAIELYPHPEVLQTKDEGTAFTECYAVLEKIMGSTPGKGDGS